MATPASLWCVKIFLGVVGYHQQFIPRFSELAEPLVYLLHKLVAFSYDDAQYSAFCTLFDDLTLSHVLDHPDLNHPFILFSDANNITIGDILSQCDENGFDLHIVYYRKTLYNYGSNYNMTEKEWLAVFLEIKRSQSFLYVACFTIVADCSTLEWL